jgi:hypothetical protein
MKYLLPTILVNVILFLSSPVIGGENCSQLGGACKNACGQTDRAEYGAFEDCGEGQECCVVHDASRDQIRCCIASFETQHYGALNCGIPKNNQCSQGSGSPVSCENLTFCMEKK